VRALGSGTTNASRLSAAFCPPRNAPTASGFPAGFSISASPSASYGPVYL
jgi:hypothetical protein